MILLIFQIIHWTLTIAANHLYSRILPTPHPVNGAPQLPLWIRSSFKGQLEYMEINIGANVGELRTAIQNQLKITEDGFIISFACQELHDPRALLMDIGLSAESVLDITSMKLSPIIVLQAFLEHFQTRTCHNELQILKAIVDEEAKVYRLNGTVYSHHITIPDDRELIILRDYSGNIKVINLNEMGICGTLNLDLLPEECEELYLRHNYISQVQYNASHSLNLRYLDLFGQMFLRQPDCEQIRDLMRTVPDFTLNNNAGLSNDQMRCLSLFLLGINCGLFRVCIALVERIAYGQMGDE